MIKLFLIVLAIFFVVVLYGEVRQGHWNDVCSTMIDLLLIYLLWLVNMNFLLK